MFQTCLTVKLEVIYIKYVTILGMKFIFAFIIIVVVVVVVVVVYFVHSCKSTIGHVKR
jgi:Na+-transporting methylmalonyl-CoA/oxaloacetate decarboxylase gamma subunit